MLLDDKINVMIVNDSRLLNELLTNIIDGDEIKVVSKAFNGADALRKLKHVRPDVILLDLEMPTMDGFAFLNDLMESNPIPVIIVSSYGEQGSKIVFDALKCGAVDFLQLPFTLIKDTNTIKEILIEKIKVASKAKPHLITISNKKIKKSKIRNDSLSQKLIVIGASTGGPAVVRSIISNLPSDLNAAVIVIQHMSDTFIKYFAERLANDSALKVKEAEDGEMLKSGTVLVAPGKYHLAVDAHKCVRLYDGTPRMGVKPCINVTMISASEVYGSDTIGVLLSGMGYDGAFGLKMIRKRGGLTIAQDEESSIIFGMAKEAEKLNAVDKFVPADHLAKEIVSELGQK